MRGARAIAAAAVLALGASACAGSASSTQPPVPTVKVVASSAVRFVGVGDSLTAGVQSGGLYGQSGGEPNPVAASFFPFLPTLVPYTTVPSTQNNGYYALIWSGLNGGSVLTPATSPLPLMNAPLGAMYVPSSITGATGGAPQLLSTPCSGANGAAFNASTANQIRLNPGVSPYDVAVPGQTLHEALTMIAPTATCASAYDPTNPYAGLAYIVNAESNAFYPILGTFNGLSQVQAAVSLKPQYAVVWLGSNDLLKPLTAALGGAAFPFTDPTAFYNDMVSVIKQLQGAGAKVVVLNLPDVLHASYFTGPAELTALMTQDGVPGAVQSYYLSLIPTGGYLTLSGFYKILGSIEALPAAPNVTLVAGDTVPAALATQVQSYNDQYNTEIANAATATGAPLADIHALYAQIYTGGGYPLSARCCSPTYSGGLTSVDGIHPSNTGYAIIANTVIPVMNQAFSLSIPLANLPAIYATDPYAPH